MIRVLIEEFSGGDWRGSESKDYDSWQAALDDQTAQGLVLNEETDTTDQRTAKFGLPNFPCSYSGWMRRLVSVKPLEGR